MSNATNIYTYTHNDPLNGTDPDGEADCNNSSGGSCDPPPPPPPQLPPVVVTAHTIPLPNSSPNVLPEIVVFGARAARAVAMGATVGLATVINMGLVSPTASDDTTMSAEQETLTGEEQEAVRNKEAGKPYDKKAFNRARQKQIKNEKYAGQRNSGKQQGGG